MQLIKIYQKILSLQEAIFRTEDIAIMLSLTNKAAYQILNRLKTAGFILHLRRGVWAVKDKIEPLMLPEYLTAPLPSYISLQTALQFHGIIEQIPTIIYAVSIARTREFKTAIGQISIHHIQPQLFKGFAILAGSGIKMASAEKAVFDFFYFKSTRSKLFYSLPEVEIPDNFNWEQMQSYAAEIENVSRKAMVLKQIAHYSAASRR